MLRRGHGRTWSLRCWVSVLHLLHLRCYSQIWSWMWIFWTNQPTRQKWKRDRSVGWWMDLLKLWSFVGLFWDCFELYRGIGLRTNTIAELFKVEGVLCGSATTPEPSGYNYNLPSHLISSHVESSHACLSSPPPFYLCNAHKQSIRANLNASWLSH